MAFLTLLNPSASPEVDADPQQAYHQHEDEGVVLEEVSCGEDPPRRQANDLCHKQPETDQYEYQPMQRVAFIHVNRGECFDNGTAIEPKGDRDTNQQN